MNISIVLIIICFALLVYLNIKRSNLKNDGYLEEFLKNPDGIITKSEWMSKLNFEFNKEVKEKYQKDLDDLDKNELLDLYLNISKQRCQAILENKTYHKNVLTMMYYKLFSMVRSNDLYSETELKEIEHIKLKELFSTREYSKLQNYFD